MLSALKTTDILDSFAKAKRSHLPAAFLKAGADLQGALEPPDCLVVTARVPGEEERFAITNALGADDGEIEAAVRAAISWMRSVLLTRGFV